MKFRIVEQRGVFRIMTCRKYDKEIYGDFKWYEREGRGQLGKVRKVIGHETVVEWWFCAKCADEEFVNNDDRYRGSVIIGLVSPDNYNPVVEYEFDTYQKAENYIKKFYGSTGVDAIEKRLVVKGPAAGRGQTAPRSDLSRAGWV